MSLQSFSISLEMSQLVELYHFLQGAVQVKKPLLSSVFYDLYTMYILYCLSI